MTPVVISVYFDRRGFSCRHCLTSKHGLASLLQGCPTFQDMVNRIHLSGDIGPVPPHFSVHAALEIDLYADQGRFSMRFPLPQDQSKDCILNMDAESGHYDISFERVCESPRSPQSLHFGDHGQRVSLGISAAPSMYSQIVHQMNLTTHQTSPRIYDPQDGIEIVD